MGGQTHQPAIRPPPANHQAHANQQEGPYSLCADYLGCGQCQPSKHYGACHDEGEKAAHDSDKADARIIRVWKDERVIGVVSLGGRFLQAPCRGTLCTFDLARLPGFYTCQDSAHVTPRHIDILLPLSST